MKKTRMISLAVALTMIVQMCSFTAIFADENAEKGLEILQKIGAVSAEDIENAGQSVNRAEFTQYAAKVLGSGEIKNKMYFKDLPTDHWANPHISALVEIGVIDLADDGFFNPDSPVTPEQAYKIMLVGLGYKEHALNEAEIMTGYTIAARKTGIWISTRSAESLTIAEAAEIIYNAMSIGYARVVTSGDEVVREVFPEDTLMNMHNLVESEGTVTAVYGASTDSGVEVKGANIAYIDDVEYLVDNDVNVAGLLGQYVEFVYRNDGSRDKTILYVKAFKDDVTKIRADLIESFDPDTYELKYYKDDEATKTSRLTFPDGVKVVYNGKVYGGRIATIMNEFIAGTKHGEISIIENSQTQETLLIVKSYRTVVAKSYSDSNEVFFDYYSAVDNLDLSDYQVVRYINADGKAASKPADFIAVLDVAESEDKTTAEVVVCDKQITGILTTVYSNDAEIRIDDTVYKMTDTAWNKFGTAIKSGASVTAWLDSVGRIAYIKVSNEGGMQAGYLMDMTCYSDGFDMIYLFKMFTNGAVSVFELADKVVLDETKFEMTEHKKFFLNFPLVSGLTDSSVTIEPQVIRYELDKDGKIAKIDTTAVGANEEADKTLKLVHDGEGDTSKRLLYVSGLKRFGSNYLYDSSYTDVFALPQGVEDGMITINGNKVAVDDSMYSSSASFTNLTSHDLQIYDYDAENPFSEIIVTKQSPTVNEQDIYMVHSVVSMLNDEEAVVTGIKCIGTSGEKTMVVDEGLVQTARELKMGDIIIVDTDLQGKKVYNIERYVKSDDKSFGDGPNRNASNLYWYSGTYNPYGDSFIVTARSRRRNVTKGYAYDIQSNVLEVMYEFDGNVSERTNAGSLPVIVYDSNYMGGEIYEGTLGDIETYKTSGTGASLVVTGYYNENARCIFVYK